MVRRLREFAPRRRSVNSQERRIRWHGMWAILGIGNPNTQKRAIRGRRGGKLGARGRGFWASRARAAENL